MSDFKLTKEQTEQIEEIVKNFHSSKVRDIMHQFNHHWYIGGSLRLPEVEDIIKTIRTLLKLSFETSEYYEKGEANFVSSGGLEVYNVDGFISVSYVPVRYELDTYAHDKTKDAYGAVVRKYTRRK